MIAHKPFWDKQAASYAKRAIGDEAAYEATLARVRAHLGPEDRVLELGCGTGSTALRLAPDVAHITATDIAPEMIRIGQEKARAEGVGNVTLREGAPGDAALREGGRYDAVIAFNLLHLLEDLPHALTQIAELVKPGGLFISKTFCTPGRGQANLQYRAIRLALPVLQFLGKVPFVSFRSVEDLEAEVCRAGFTVLERGDYPARPPRRLLVARKL